MNELYQDILARGAVDWPAEYLPKLVDAGEGPATDLCMLPNRFKVSSNGHMKLLSTKQIPENR
jgi:hypothetical protein